MNFPPHRSFNACVLVICLCSLSSLAFTHSNRAEPRPAPDRVFIDDVFQVQAVSLGKKPTVAETQFLQSIHFDGKTLSFDSSHGDIRAKTTSAYMNMCESPPWRHHTSRRSYKIEARKFRNFDPRYRFTPTKK